MWLEKVRGFHNEIIIQPEDIKDLTVFKHCTGGKEWVYSKGFKREYEPVFKLHVSWIRIVDRSKKK